MTLYYEAHIYIDEVYGYKFDHFAHICSKYEFQVSKASPRICTGSGQSLEDLSFTLGSLIEELQQNNIYVWRYKLEDIIMDSNNVDRYKLLSKKKG